MQSGQPHETVLTEYSNSLFPRNYNLVKGHVRQHGAAVRHLFIQFVRVNPAAEERGGSISFVGGEHQGDGIGAL